MADANDAARASLFGPRRGGGASAAAPVSSGDLGFEDTSAPASSSATPPEDAARSALLAGGRRRAAVVKAAADAAPPAAAPPAGGDAGGDGAPDVMPLGEMFEGDVSFDFEGLNMMATAAEGGGGGGGGDGALDFTAIDDDLARFSQDPVIRDALNRGVDLRSYSRQVDAELRAMEALSVADYVRESDSIAGLFSQIVSCEKVLTTMQSLLQGFQDNLGGISDEIRSLQEESLALSIKMQNRRNVSGKVKAFLAKVAVSEKLIERICDAPIDDAWLRDLRALSEKIEFCSGALRDRDARDKLATHAAGLVQPALPPDEAGSAYALDSLAELAVNPLETPAGRDSVPQVEKLRIKAVARVRDFFLRGIADTVKVRGNMQKQQEHSLVKYAYAMAFLAEHGPEAAREVRGIYSDSMGRTYGDIFKRYADDMGKAVVPGPARTDLLGVFEGAGGAGATAGGAVAAAGGGGASASGGVGASRPFDPFNLADGGRTALIADGGANEKALLVHIVQAEKTRLPWESVFRSVQRHLLDVCGGEEFAARKIFGEAKEGKDVLAATLKSSTTTALDFAETHIATSWDALGLLLALAITAAQKTKHVQGWLML